MLMVANEIALADHSFEENTRRSVISTTTCADESLFRGVLNFETFEVSEVTTTISPSDRLSFGSLRGPLYA